MRFLTTFSLSIVLAYAQLHAKDVPNVKAVAAKAQVEDSCSSGSSTVACNCFESAFASAYSDSYNNNAPDNSFTINGDGVL